MILLKHNIGVFQNLVGLFLILFSVFYVNGISVADEVRTKRSETRLPPITQPSAKAVSLIRELGMTDLGAALIEKLLEADTIAVRAGYQRQEADGRLTLTKKWAQDISEGRLDLSTRPLIFSGGPELEPDAESFGVVQLPDRFLIDGHYETGEAIDPVSVVYREIMVQHFNAASGVWLWREREAAKIENRIRVTRKHAPRKLSYAGRDGQMINGTDGKKYGFTIDVESGHIYEGIVKMNSSGVVVNLRGKPVNHISAKPDIRPVGFVPQERKFLY